MKKSSAIKIQKIFRSYFDRKLFKLKYSLFWYNNIYLPSIIKIQSYLRGYNVRKDIALLKLRQEKANVIKRNYIRYKDYQFGKKLREEIQLLKKNNYVMLIQKNVRTFLQRKKYKELLLISNGKKNYAAKIILRVWRNYKFQLKFKELIEENLKMLEKKKLKILKNLRSEIINDIKEARVDISNVKSTISRAEIRLKEIDTFDLEASIRLKKIKLEMDKLTTEDFERGWAESLCQEYEYIIHQQLMCREEYRLLKNRLIILNNELLDLHIEIEEAEVEYDDLNCEVIELFEKSRRRQIQYAQMKANRHLMKLIYRERVHWKIETNRTLKIRKERLRKHQENTKVSSKFNNNNSFDLFHNYFFFSKLALIEILHTILRLTQNIALKLETLRLFLLKRSWIEKLSREMRNLVHVIINNMLFLSLILTTQL